MTTKHRKRTGARGPVPRGRTVSKAGAPTQTPQRARVTPKTAGSKRAASAVAVEVGLRQKPPGRPEQTRAFFEDARHANDELAEELGESFVLSATSGEDPEEHYQSERPEEEGGPFLETSGHTEFAYGVDESNPEDAEPAPWPAVSPGQPPPHRSGGPR
ncbi:MAG: hypothetical protein ACLQDQ_13950 [Myxococcaceae bacterium]